MGGVRSDRDGRTSVPGLYAAGEVACTGVHGANRLASNSLLEGLVFGARAGAAMRDERQSGCRGEAPPIEIPCATEQQVRALAWDRCGIVRSGEGLAGAVDLLGSLGAKTAAAPSLAPYELRNMHTVTLLIARCALARQESRGAHYRTDYPPPPAEFREASTLPRGAPGPPPPHPFTHSIPGYFFPKNTPNSGGGSKIEFQPHETENSLDHGDLRAP